MQIIAIILIAGTLMTSPTHREELTPETSEPWAAVRRGWDALRAEDVDGFMRTLHPEFLGWNMSRDAPLDFGAEREGTEAFLAEYDWVSYEIDLAAIRIVEDDAVVHYRYREVVKRTSDGSVHEENGRATQVLKRHRGEWKTFTIMSGSVSK